MSATLTEPLIVERLYAIQKEGAVARHTGKSPRYRANTLAHFEHVTGWLIEDLRCALCRADFDYAYGQALAEAATGCVS